MGWRNDENSGWTWDPNYGEPGAQATVGPNGEALTNFNREALNMAQDPNQAAVQPMGWDVARLGNFEDYKPVYNGTLQNDIDNYEHNYILGPGRGNALDRPWTSDPEVQRDGQALVDAYNKRTGQNISLSQLPVSQWAAGRPSDHKASNSIMDTGFPLLLGAGAGAAFGAGAAGNLSSLAETGGSALPANYGSMLADAGGTLSDAAPAAAGTVSGGSTGSLLEQLGIGSNISQPLGIAGTVAGAAGSLAGGSNDTMATNQLTGGGGANWWDTTFGSGNGTSLDAGGKFGGAAPTVDALGNPLPGNAFDLSNSASGSTVPSTGTSGSGSWMNSLANALGGAGNLKTLGSLGTGAADLFGTLQRNAQLKSISDRTWNAGAPSRARVESAMTPGFDLNSMPGFKSAEDTSADAFTRALSAKGGNPALNPSAQAETQKYLMGSLGLPAWNSYVGLNSANGGLPTLAAQSTQAATGSANATADPYNVAGKTVANLTNPPSDLQSLLAQLKQMGMAGSGNVSQLALPTGGG